MVSLGLSEFGRLGVIIGVSLLVLCGIGIGGVTAAEYDNQSAIVHEDVSSADGEIEVIVSFEDPDVTGLSAADAEQSLKQESTLSQQPLNELADRTSGVTIERNFWLTNAALVTVDADSEAFEKIATLKGVTAVSPNAKIEPASTTGSSGTNAQQSTVVASRPSQPDTSSSTAEATYGLEQLNVPETWDEFDTRGEGVRVAVLDTGVDPDHPDIDLHTDDPTDPTYPGGWAEFNLLGDEMIDSEPYDIDGHGTHVSGTVHGGTAGNQHIGVAPEAELIHGNVLGPNGRTVGAGIGGMEWAVQNDADIISMSLSAEDGGEDFIQPIRNAEQQGVLVVAASGNDPPDVTGSPGNVYDSIAVGATDEFESVAPFSSGETIQTYSTWNNPPADWPSEYVVPDVVAPGVSVESAVPGGGYAAYHGTSMATPHVAGVAALMQSATDDHLSPDELEESMVESAWKPAGEQTGQDTRYGHGIIDAHAATESVSDEPVESPTVGDATRLIQDDAIASGGETTVSIDIEILESGSLEIVDSVDKQVSIIDLEVTADDISDLTTDMITTGDGTFVMIDAETSQAGTLTITYDLHVAETSTESSLEFDGTVTDHFEQTRIAGDESIRIESDDSEAEYFESIADDDGVVRTGGLRDGIDQWRAGVINTDLLRETIDAWRTGVPVSS